MDEREALRVPNPPMLAPIDAYPDVVQDLRSGVQRPCPGAPHWQEYAQVNGPFRFHVVSLPWTHTTAEYSWCAYTQKVVRFAKMMTARGHEVIVYSGVENEAEATEHVVAITPDEQGELLGTTDAPWDNMHPLWVAMNIRAAHEIAKRRAPTDFLCLISAAQEPIATFLPAMQAVEFGIGYGHTFASFRVFESYAWMHTIYGHRHGHDWDGHNYDQVIPNYFDPADFGPVRAPDQPPYFLFIGRGIRRKGPHIAQQVAEHLGIPLILAGHDLGGIEGTYGDRIGPVSPEQRRDLMAGATALFAPTLYGGPFEGVAVEALLSGCPVICTDWGAFTETVQDGDGWRCHTMAEFVDAGRAALGLEASLALGAPVTSSDLAFPWTRQQRRARAIDRYSLDAVAPMYERYFGRLMELWGEGWPAMEHWAPPTT